MTDILNYMYISSLWFKIPDFGLPNDEDTYGFKLYTFCLEGILNERSVRFGWFPKIPVEDSKGFFKVIYQNMTERSEHHRHAICKEYPIVTNETCPSNPSDVIL